MPASVVDGMDVDAVHEEAAAGVAHARAGAGPSFLECRTYRYFGHHTGERTMSLTYRTEEEIETWRARDPVATFGARLDSAVRARIDQAVEVTLDEAIAFARASERPRADDAYEYTYASPIPVRRGSC
jgi:pyruvate dehydrogenase E1 component alpha subunit